VEVEKGENMLIKNMARDDDAVSEEVKVSIPLWSW
jgi:hypothetical protein